MHRSALMGAYYRSTNDKYSLLLSTNPLHHFVCALRKSIPVGIRTCYTVQLEERRNPREGD